MHESNDQDVRQVCHTHQLIESPQQPGEAGPLTISILETRKPKLREVKRLVKVTQREVGKPGRKARAAGFWSSCSLFHTTMASTRITCKRIVDWKNE